jgi:lysophospholipase L1-like esterase
VKRLALSRRTFALYALLAAACAAVGTAVLILGLDLYVHHRAARSAGLNIWGYRGPLVGNKDPGELRIAVLGGSTAFGYGLLWNEAAPAVLERRLRAKRPGRSLSVVNLAYNNEGAYSYRFTLDDFRFLAYDVVVLYDGYNDLAGDSRPNTALYRHDSPVFRVTGYFPILPLALRERAMMLRNGGDLAGAYEAIRGRPATVFRPNVVDRGSAATMEAAADIGETLGRQLGRLSELEAPRLPNTAESGCTSPWSHYCQSMFLAISYARARGNPVLVVLQPRAVEPLSEKHAQQQAALLDMLQRKFGNDPNVHAVDLSAVISLHDQHYSLDGLHLSTEGTALVTGLLADKMAPMLGWR